MIMQACDELKGQTNQETGYRQDKQGRDWM